MNLSRADTLMLQRYFAGKPVKRAFVFGSYARNTAINGSSDIDILVELDHTSPIGMKIFAYRLELEKLLHTKVDLISSEGISPFVRPYIDKDKILIYERQPR
jgi:uncharacterized protein